MSGTVRNPLRYVLVSYEGVVNEDYVIFVNNSSDVTVYTCDGECFDGDLLALEAFAALNKSVACPVEPYPDFTGEITEITHPSEVPFVVDDPVADWSEDHENNSDGEQGVNLASVDDKPTPSGDGHVTAGDTVDVNSIEAAHAPAMERAGGEIPREMQGHAFHLGQGLGIYDHLVLTDRRHQHLMPGSVIPLGMVSTITPENYGTAVRKKRIPRRPMVLCRDLGNCLMGMPTFVGTTIAGPLRPDTGGKDPSIADHDMWLQYGLLGPS
jgi:hypothetical protein